MTTLDLPWPPSCLTPNAKRRSHWRKYAGPTKDYREVCAWLSKEAGWHKRDDDAPHMSITFHPPDNRRRDLDGMLGAFKAGLDGIADAMGVDDSRWSLSIARGGKVPGGAVVVRLSAATQSEAPQP